MKALIFGHGKTGSTALTYRLKAALPDHEIIFEPNPLPENCNDNTIVKYFSTSPEDEISKLDNYDKKILLVRHPFDYIVSFILYIPASLPEFSVAWRGELFKSALKGVENKTTPFKKLFYALSAVTSINESTILYQLKNTMKLYRAADPDKFFTFNYEDLVANRFEGLSKYLGVHLGADGEVDAQYAHVSRTKNVDNWRHWFSTEDVEFFGSWPAIREYAEIFGYDLTLSLADPQIRNSSDGSDYVSRMIARNCSRLGMREPIQSKDGTKVADPCGGAEYDLEQTYVGAMWAMKFGAKGEAIDGLLASVIGGYGSVYSFFELGRAFLKERKYLAAEIAALRALEGNNDYSGSWYLLAEIRIAQNRPNEAIFAAQRACELSPDNHHHHMLFANIAGKMGKWEEVEIQLRAAGAHSQIPAVYARPIAAAMWEQGRSDEAIAYLQEAMTLAPTAWDLPFMLANILQSNLRTNEAIEYAQKAQELTDDPAPAELVLHLSSKLTYGGEI